MSPTTDVLRGTKLRGKDMDQLDAISRDIHYVRGRLDKHIDENTAAHADLRSEVADLRTDVVTNSAVIDNKMKGLIAGASGSISAIVAGIMMYLNGGSGG